MIEKSYKVMRKTIIRKMIFINLFKIRENSYHSCHPCSIKKKQEKT